MPPGHRGSGPTWQLAMVLTAILTGSPYPLARPNTGHRVCTPIRALRIPWKLLLFPTVYQIKATLLRPGT